MKRSELRNLISDNVLINFYPNMDLQTRNLIADCMLAEAEKYGMLPPLNLPEGVEEELAGYCRWEPENEKGRQS